MKESRFRLDRRKNFFYDEGGDTLEHLRGEMLGTRLPREVLDTPLLEILKIRLDRALSDLI